MAFEPQIPGAAAFDSDSDAEVVYLAQIEEEVRVEAPMEEILKVAGVEVTLQTGSLSRRWTYTWLNRQYEGGMSTEEARAKYEVAYANLARADGDEEFGDDGERLDISAIVIE